NHKAKVDRDFAHQASLITQAKAEFKKKNMPQEIVTEGGEGELWFLPSTSERGSAVIVMAQRTFCETRSLVQHVNLAAFSQQLRGHRVFTSEGTAILTFETVISDPNDPKFDLEGYLTALMGEKAK
ncbi:MAG: hypothetical protein L6R42_010292, partial [Xanthoria sp. 1 TBL-2021]